MPPVERQLPFPTHRIARITFAIGVLAVALGLRVYLVAKGGAFYWTDEKRYQASREAVSELVEGDIAAAAHFLLSTSDHIGFRWLGLVPAAIERVVFGLEPPHARVCAGFFALFSVANLFLIWRIAGRLRSTDWEPELALVLAASSNALFFFARHCVPYDASLFFFLAAVYVGVGPTRAGQSVWVGALCGFGYLVYNGYWSVGAVVLALEVLWRREPFGPRLRRAGFALLGLITPIAATFVIAQLFGYDLVAHARSFAGTVNQGDFGEGWRFIFEYLVVADGVLPVILMAVVTYASYAALVQRPASPWLRWAAAVVLLFMVWIALSDLVHTFVLYGRTVRAVIPFLVLAAAGAAGSLARKLGHHGRRLLYALVAVSCVASMAKMIPPLRQLFPVDFRLKAQHVIGEAQKDDSDRAFAVLHADYLYGPEPAEETRPHRELLRRSHPHRYAPYLFEGYTRAQRPLYQRPVFDMRLIELDRAGGRHVLQRTWGARRLAPYPGPLSLRVRFSRERVGTSEALLTHGDARELRDLLFVEYTDVNHVRIGLRHGAEPVLLSPPLACDYASEHTLIVTLGSFYPRDFSPAALRGRYVIRFNGETALVGAGEFAAAKIDALALGAAIVPAEGAPRPFTGVILSALNIDPGPVADNEWLLAQPREQCFAAHHGPVELELRLPHDAAGRSQPLIASGKRGAADLLFVTYLDSGHIRLALDHWGAPLLQSAPIAVNPGEVQRILVSMGSLFAPAGDVAYDEMPDLVAWRQRLLVQVNGQTVLTRASDFFAAEPSDIAFGACATGATTAEARFTGEILRVRPCSPGELGIREGRLPPVRGPFFGHHAGPLELTLRFPATLPEKPEPLLVTGRTGAADMLCVTYLDTRRVRFTLDHWGGPPLHSRTFEIEPGATHRLMASFGSLYPDQNDVRYAASPGARILRDWLEVRLNDLVVFSQPCAFFPAGPDELYVGRNPLGGTAAAPLFTGELIDQTRRTPESLGLTEEKLAWPTPLLTPEDVPAAGLRLRFQLPATWDPGAEPLMKVGQPASSQLVFIKYRGSHRFQIGHRRSGGLTEYSRALPTAPGRTHTLTLWRTRLEIDGQPLLPFAADALLAQPGAIHLGRDYFGTKGLRGRFTGKLLGVEAVPSPR